MASLEKAATHCKQVAAWLSFHASLWLDSVMLTWFRQLI